MSLLEGLPAALPSQEPLSKAEQMRRLRARRRELGLKTVNLDVPEELRAPLKELERLVRDEGQPLSTALRRLLADNSEDPAALQAEIERLRELLAESQRITSEVRAYGQQLEQRALEAERARDDARALADLRDQQRVTAERAAADAAKVAEETLRPITTATGWRRLLLWAVGVFELRPAHRP